MVRSSSCSDTLTSSSVAPRAKVFQLISIGLLLFGYSSYLEKEHGPGENSEMRSHRGMLQEIAHEQSVYHESQHAPCCFDGLFDVEFVPLVDRSKGIVGRLHLITRGRVALDKV